MSKTHSVDVDCTRKCRSQFHGQAITGAITKRSISDQALASFLKATCANFMQAHDFEGRTALHMSASRGRLPLTDWLVRHAKDIQLNAKDRESGYTPLHRSIFYGQIHVAVGLMRYGVSLDAVDKDDFRPLQHALLDRQYIYRHSGTQPADVYVWGSNSNYTLGTGTQKQRDTPDVLGCFATMHATLRQVCLGKFHSVWVCDVATGGVGAVFACGQVARAGAPNITAVTPILLKMTEPVLQATVMLNATVFLLQSGAVIQYSLNSNDTSINQSKTPSSIKLPSVKPLIKLSEPTGICSSRHHAVVWNKRAIYTWGVNVGQLGHPQGDRMIEGPKRVMLALNMKDEINLELSAAADAATVVSTSRGDVYLLHKYLCKKIAVKQINLREISVDSKINEQGVLSRVTVLLLTKLGQLYIWQDSTNRLTRCVFGLTHQTTISQVTLTHDAMYFTTKYGEAYIGHISRKPPSAVPVTPLKKDKDRDNGKSALVKFLEKDDCTSVRLTRIPNIHRGVSIVVDGEGINFACLQIKPTCGLTSLPELSPSSVTKHMGSLLDTCSQDDLLHDVIFKVGTQLCPAHMFIIASGSEHLLNLYQDKKNACPNEVPILTLENILPEAFERVLRWLYTGTCDVTEPGPCNLKIRKDDIKSEKEKANNIDEELIENATEISAFEAYKKQDSKAQNRKNRRQRSSDTPPRTHLYCDPVKLVQATAKRLHVMGLHKALDKFYCRDSTIFVRDPSSHKPCPPVWNRESCPELVDTNVCSKDGHQISAHKCILAARLEYFQGMFMHSWTESKTRASVTLPINHSILLPVINFLYTDSCPEIENSDSIDFICNLLVVADQLFVSRLREMCEIALANLVTLKNCAELCQFAHTYNAAQLKQCCMEFISLNLCTILENKSLEMLDENLLEDISKYYCRFNPIMSSRVITPFYNAPSDDVIEGCLQTCPVDLEATDENLRIDDVLESKRRKSKKPEYTENEKARKRYESVSSVNSLDLSLDTSGDITLSLSKLAKTPEKSTKEKQEKWTTVPTTQQKVQARLKAISSAKDILKETPVESFTTLTKSPSTPLVVGSAPQFTRLSMSPKETPLADLALSPPGNIVISHVGPKLSQKQRKKLALQGDSSSQSLDEYLSNKLVVESPPKRNPWKVIAPPSSSAGPTVVKAPQFNQILADQKKQRDDSDRIMTKSLAMTQLEDKAIEELERFYSIHEIDDELISVQRIALPVSAPKWINTAPTML